MNTVIYSSEWPQLYVKNIDEAFMVGDDMIAYDAGEITDLDFIALWGIHPDDEFVIAVEVS